MSAVDIMMLVRQLSHEEVLELGQMLDEWRAGIADQKLEAAVLAGAFDDMAAQALREHAAGETIPLDEVLDECRLS